MRNNEMFHNRDHPNNTYKDTDNQIFVLTDKFEGTFTYG